MTQASDHAKPGNPLEELMLSMTKQLQPGKEEKLAKKNVSKKKPKPAIGDIEWFLKHLDLQRDAIEENRQGTPDSSNALMSMLDPNYGMPQLTQIDPAQAQAFIEQMYEFGGGRESTNIEDRRQEGPLDALIRRVMGGG